MLHCAVVVVIGGCAFIVFGKFGHIIHNTIIFVSKLFVCVVTRFHTHDGTYGLCTHNPCTPSRLLFLFLANARHIVFLAMHIFAVAG